jgi:uncharacterized protein YkwD
VFFAWIRVARALLEATTMRVLRAMSIAAGLFALVGVGPGCDGQLGGGMPGTKGPRLGGGIRLVDGGVTEPEPGPGSGGEDAGVGLGGDDAGPEMVPPVPGDPTPDGGAAYTCAELGYQGICDGEVARWCDEGEIRFRDCAAMGQTCRWIDSTTGYYCADGTGPSDPGGTDPGGGGGTDPAPTGCASAVEQEELDLTNSARASAGLPALVCDEALARAARLHSQDMCDQGYFSHTSRDGRSFTQRLDAQGASYGGAGENIAWGQRTPNEVHSAWMGSSGHRANILGSSFRRIGIGHVDCGGSPYWTQDFTD